MKIGIMTIKLIYPIATVAVITGYIIVNAVTSWNDNMIRNATSGTMLTSTGWNALVNNVDYLSGQMATMSMRWTVIRPTGPNSSTSVSSNVLTILPWQLTLPAGTWQIRWWWLGDNQSLNSNMSTYSHFSLSTSNSSAISYPSGFQLHLLNNNNASYTTAEIDSVITLTSTTTLYVWAFVNWVNTTLRASYWSNFCDWYAIRLQ